MKTKTALKAGCGGSNSSATLVNIQVNALNFGGNQSNTNGSGNSTEQES